MLNRVGVASSFALTASLLSGIAAVASTIGPTVIAALPARSATSVPIGTGAVPRVAGDSAHASPTPLTNGVAQPGPANSGAAPSTPHQPTSGPRPVSKPPTNSPTGPSTKPPPSTAPTTAPSASPAPYNCAGSDDAMTEAYKHAREQYCQGGGE